MTFQVLKPTTSLTSSVNCPLLPFHLSLLQLCCWRLWKEDTSQPLTKVVLSQQFSALWIIHPSLVFTFHVPQVPINAHGRNIFRSSVHCQVSESTIRSPQFPDEFQVILFIESEHIPFEIGHDEVLFVWGQQNTIEGRVAGYFHFPDGL